MVSESLDTLALIAKLCYNFVKLVFHYIVGEGQEREMNTMGANNAGGGHNKLVIEPSTGETTPGGGDSARIL